MVANTQEGGGTVRVLNFGSLNLDYVYDVDHINQAGETQLSDHLRIFPGGKGLNQSIALSKSGVSVFHAGAVGKSDSAVLLEALKSVGVNTEHVMRLDCQSGHAIIQRDKQGQNSILLFGGANQRISTSQVQRIMAEFGPGDFLVLQNEISHMTEIMEQAHNQGMTIVLNPSPMTDSLLDYPLEYVDYLILNEIEAIQLSGVNTTPEEQAEAISRMLPHTRIVLTLGEEGSLYYDKGDVLRQSAYRTVVVDTTAAGDTFAGYFISAILRGRPVSEALDLASRASAIAVSRSGAAPSIPTMEEVEDKAVLL